MVTTILARGTTPTERERSIETICSLLDDSQTGPTADDLRGMYEWTEEHASTHAERPSTGTRLYIHAGTATCSDRQGPDHPARAATARAARAARDNDESHALVIDTLAGINTEEICDLVADRGVAVIDAQHRITLHVKPARDSLPPSMQRALEVLAGTAEHADALLAGVEWRGGRPPLGTTSEGGRLAPADDYDDVCRTLQLVNDDVLSKSQAAERLDCARKTVANALQRPELYRLD